METKPTDYRPPTRPHRRVPPWLNRVFVVDMLKTLLWAVPLTILIWIYAEREQVINPLAPNVGPVPVQITTSEPDKWVVEPVGGETPTIKLKLTGPQQAIEQVRDTLNQIPPRLVIDLGDHPTEGDNQRISVKDRIENNRIFRQFGVSVEECQPGELSFNVAHVKEVTVDVEPPAEVKAVAESVVFTPAKVTIRGPHLKVDQTPAVANFAGKVDLHRPGLQDIAGLTIDMPAGVRVNPVKVDARVVIREAETYVIPSMPIIGQAPFPVTNDYQVILDPPVVSQTTVTGPKEQIDLLRPDDANPSKKVFFPQAVLVMTSNDIREPTPKTLIYILPEGVHETKEMHDRKFSFRLQHR